MNTCPLARITGLGVVVILMSLSSSARAECYEPLPTQPARPIYMINPGPVDGCDDCHQGQDAGLVEFLDFQDTQDVHAPVQGIVGDEFGPCPPGQDGHGMYVSNFFRGFGPDPTEVQNQVGMATLVHDMIDAMTGAAAVGNLSVSDGLGSVDPERVDAFIEAHENGLLLVGVPMTYGSIPQELRQFGDRVLMLYKSDQSEPVAAGDPPNLLTNLAAMHFAASWNDGGTYLTVDPHLIGFNNPAYDEPAPGYMCMGSFSTPLAAGTMTHVMAVVAARGLTGAELTTQTIDYIVSSCDRPDETFAVHEGQLLASYAPWSPYWKYGFYNAWKALLYAYGFGIIDCRDNALYGVDNPVVAFSDDYELRGDLLVPAGQSLHITELASLFVATDFPEGPNYGPDPGLHEIRVAGELIISGSVDASVIVDDGGSVVVEPGASLTIAEDRRLVLSNGGTLQVDGSIVIHGEMRLNGGLLVLNADLPVSPSGLMTARGGTVIEAGAVDIAGAGHDPDRVELICQGMLELIGFQRHRVIIRAAAPDAGSWGGIRLDSTHADRNTIEHVMISDAAVGLLLAGNSDIQLRHSLFVNNTMGVKAVDRAGDTVYGCRFSESGVGMSIVNSSPFIHHCVINENQQGIHASGTSMPKIRNSILSQNTCSLVTIGEYSGADLGTYSDHGLNQFLSPGHHYNHIAGFDVGQDMYAMYNWWGTNDNGVIESLIYMSPSTYAVLYQPKLRRAPIIDTVDLVPMMEPSEKAVQSTGPTFLSPSPDRRGGAGVVVSFRLAESEIVTLTVHDIRGRRVKQLADGFMPAGDHQLFWDGLDQSGRRAASGVYFMRLSGERDVTTRKITLTR